MKPWILVPLAVAVAIPSALLFRRPASDGDAAGAPSSDGTDEKLAALAERLADLSDRQEALGGSVTSMDREAARATAPAAPSVDDADIAAAVDRWLAEHRGEDAPGATVRGADPRPPAIATSGLADLPMDRIVMLIAASGDGANAFFQELRDADRMDEFLGHVEDLAEADPKDPDVQMLRAVGYLQKIFEVGNGPEAGVWAAKADQTFDVVLALEPENWDARFTKAVALSNWPAFLGRGAEAVENLEILIRQQEARDAEPHFAQSYLVLGNIHQQAGEREKAVAVWRQGLALFPRDAELLRQLELAGN